MSTVAYRRRRQLKRQRLQAARVEAWRLWVEGGGSTGWLQRQFPDDDPIHARIMRPSPMMALMNKTGTQGASGRSWTLP